MNDSAVVVATATFITPLLGYIILWAGHPDAPTEWDRLVIALTGDGWLVDADEPLFSSDRHEYWVIRRRSNNVPVRASVPNRWKPNEKHFG